MTELNREVEVFTQAARWADGVVRDLSTAAWSGPGLGDWNMRALVGHTSRALLTVEQYLDRPAEAEEVASAAEYYERAATAQAADSAAVLGRGIEAGAALGDDLAAAFGSIVERVTRRIAAVADGPDAPIVTIVGGMRLSAYLPTRTFELIVHGLDIAGAAHLPARAPGAALRRTIELATDLAVREGSGELLLRSLTGRDRLGDGFSVLP